jgi:hypothetical protein
MILVAGPYRSGPSEGADRMVTRARAEDKGVYTSLADVPAAR